MPLPPKQNRPRDGMFWVLVAAAIYNLAWGTFGLILRRAWREYRSVTASA